MLILILSYIYCFFSYKISPSDWLLFLFFLIFHFGNTIEYNTTTTNNKYTKRQLNKLKTLVIHSKKREEEMLFKDHYVSRKQYNTRANYWIWTEFKLFSSQFLFCILKVFKNSLFFYLEKNKIKWKFLPQGSFFYLQFQVLPSSLELNKL